MPNSKLRAVARTLVRAVYPNRCACCGRVMEDKGLCRGCNALMNRVEGTTCALCGQLVAECECGIIKPKLNGFTAPFYNSGRSSNALYRLKFAGAVSAADYFGKRMAERFKDRFPEAVPDGVCYVPDAHSSKKRNGYYTTYLLAVSLAKHLEIPIWDDALIQTKPTRRQHTLDRKERLANVKGVYTATERVKGKNIIVVDDIRTTGATINECGRAVRRAGAKTVWGITAVQGRNLQYF